MRRLYLQIYLAFLGILLLFGGLVTVASLLIPLHPQEHLLLDGMGAVLSELLPGPQRPVHELQAAVEHLRRLLPIDLAVHSADGALLAAVGPPLPAPPPERSFREAAASAPGKLRVAYSLRPPPGTVGAGPDAEVRRALLETAELLRSLGHEVHDQDLDIPLDAVSHGVMRTIRGIADEARTLPHYERLDLRFRRVTRLGELIPAAALARALAAEPGVAARINRIFDDHDVVLTPVAPEPPCEVGRWEGRGMLWTLNGSARMIAFTALWNQTGQPAAAVPAGWTAGGLPLSVQLVGRPNDEGTLLSLAAQLEAERPWADRRPPVS